MNTKELFTVADVQQAITDCEEAIQPRLTTNHPDSDSCECGYCEASAALDDAYNHLTEAAKKEGKPTR